MKTKLFFLCAFCATMMFVGSSFDSQESPNTENSNTASVNTVAPTPLSGGWVTTMTGPQYIDVSPYGGVNYIPETLSDVLGTSPYGGTGVYTYQWECITYHTSMSIWLPIPGATNASYQPFSEYSFAFSSLPFINNEFTIRYRRKVTSGTETAYSNYIATYVVRQN